MKLYQHLKLNVRNLGLIACRESVLKDGQVPIARMEDFEGHACIRGYNIYKDIWEAVDGEELCEREPHNDHDRYAVAVRRKGAMGNYREYNVMARVCSLFLRRRGIIRCTVTGRRRYSRGLPEGELEVPCSLHFQATHTASQAEVLEKLISI